MPTTDELRAQDAKEYAAHGGKDWTPPPATPSTVNRAARRFIWIAAFLGIGGFAVETFISFEIQTSAPQQAAVAAWGAFRVVAVYTMARALDAVART